MGTVEVRTKFTQSARKHRIGRANVLHVMETAEHADASRDDGVVQREWVGDDPRGVELEVLGIFVEDGTTGEQILLIIHVMPTALRRGRQ